MLQPYQNRPGEYTTLIRQFGGLNRLPGAEENEFEDLSNMSSDGFPLLQPRKGRATVKTFGEGEKVVGFCNKGALVYCVEQGGSTGVFINGRQLSGVSLAPGEKQMVGMGAYVCIFPDGYFLNVINEEDRGFMGAVFQCSPTAQVPLVLTPCMFDGAALEAGTVGPTAPADPENGDVWLDTSGSQAVYNVWDAGAMMWQPMSTVYVQIRYGGIGGQFSQWDGVSIGGISDSGEDEAQRAQVEKLNLDSALIQNKGENWISVAGFLDRQVEITGGTVTIERRVPVLDFVTECNNRLWGCRFGLQFGQVVNEIYACRQGDFKNWFAYPGVSTDSYAMSVGTDGPFTGAITYLSVPIFFKEDHIHKIYGAMPASYQMAQTEARGVGKGQGKSLVTDGQTVFYRSAVDFVAYSGSYPSGISRKLGELPAHTVTAGCVGKKVYFYCETPSVAQGATAPPEGAPEGEILVFDTETGLWHREESDRVHGFVRDGHRMYLLLEDSAGIYRIDAVDGDYGTVLLDENLPLPVQEKVAWYATTASIGLGQLEAKYLRKILVRLMADRGSYVLCQISYEGGAWRDCFELYGDGSEGQQVISKSIVPARAMDFRLRFSGRGFWKLLSLGKITVQGSDKA